MQACAAGYALTYVTILKLQLVSSTIVDPEVKVRVKVTLRLSV
jgi:hypothetical protein